MEFFVDTKAELMRENQDALTLSLQGFLPDSREGFIEVTPVSVRMGVTFCVRAVESLFSFVKGCESAMRALCVTVDGMIVRCRRKVRHAFTFVSERAKNAVRRCVPRFLRL